MATTTKTRKSSARKRSSASSSNGGHNALQLLKADHREVEALFKKYEGLGPRALKARRDVVDKVIEALSVHAAIEEQVLYPQARERVSKAEDVVLESLEEHHIVKWTLSELEKMDPKEERFHPKMTVLMESVRHHVKEEEGELFPTLRDAFTRSELEELGAQLDAAKRAAPKRPHPRSPDEPPGNLLAAAAVGPLDLARSVGEAAIRKVRDVGT